MDGESINFSYFDPPLVIISSNQSTENEDQEEDGEEDFIQNTRTSSIAFYEKNKGNENVHGLNSENRMELIQQ